MGSYKLTIVTVFFQPRAGVTEPKSVYARRQMVVAPPTHALAWTWGVVLVVVVMLACVCVCVCVCVRACVWVGGVCVWWEGAFRLAVTL